MANKLEELQITKEELKCFGEALKHKEFRDMLVEYVEEINDPVNKKKYEEEITQLEKERGVEVTFIKPIPVYVIKTSVDGNILAFINVCTNEHVEKPSCQDASQDGNRGHHWSLPHLMSPPRDDISKKGSLCTVYDVLFHPDSMHLASRNSKFRDMITNISCQAVESNFNVTLDKSNLKFPKLKYKGTAHPLVIRKKVTDIKEKTETDHVDKLYDDMYKAMDEHYKTKQQNPTKPNQVQQQKSEYATPKYLIKYRNNIELHDFTNDPNAKIHAAIPKELIVEINLPLIKSSADLTLDVTEKTLKIISEKPSKYKLNITLPYSIFEDNGNAKFDVDHRKLVVTLPVKRNNTSMLLSDIGRYDSGVDSDNSPTTESPSEEKMPLIEELKSEDSVLESQCSSVQSESDVFRTTVIKSSGFLKPDLHYIFPEYSCHLFNNILSFTLNVKNVTADSIDKEYNESFSYLHVKFSSISSGYFPLYYSFFVQLPMHSIDSENLSIEAWDNNVILQIPYQPSDKILTAYYVGLSPESSEEKFVEEPSIINKKEIETITDNPVEYKPNVQVNLESDDELTIVVNPNNENESKKTNSDSSIANPVSEPIIAKPASSPQNIKSRYLSESSVDESSFSHSPGKSILKSARHRMSVSRSVSESSVSSMDDFICAASLESFIPEETEISSSMKKTVRFSDVVSRQLFRSNSSILGQKKKNQRKARNKKKAHDRKMSESENSEQEDRKDKQTQAANDANKSHKKKPNENGLIENNNKLPADFKNDLIFHLDM